MADTFSISGTVYQKVGDERTPLAGATVRAVNGAQGFTRDETTSEDGTYIFVDLPPGTWQLTAQHEGSAKPDPIVIELTADEEGQDLELTRLIRIAGTVYQYDTNARIEEAVVKATSAEGDVRFTATDDDGDFRFDELEAGTWTLVAFHEDSRPRKSKPREFRDDETDFNFELFRAMDEPDQAAGRRFFMTLCITFGVLVVAYVALHAALTPTAELLSPTLGVLLGQTADRVNDASTNPSENEELTFLLTQIEEQLETVVVENPDAFADADPPKNLLARARQAISENQPKIAAEQLDALRGMTAAPPVTSFFWSREPWRFLEVLLWGLAGILVNLILTTARYLRRHTFYREGIVQHVAQITTVPVLALVFVFVASLMKLEIGDAVKLNLSDPQVLAAGAFLIGSKPWDVWDFLQETAGRLTGAED